MTTKVIALVDVGSYKTGASIPVLGKTILLDGEVREIANLNPSIFKVVGENSVLPVYNEEFLNKVISHTNEDIMKGRYNVGDKAFRFDISTKTFVEYVVTGEVGVLATEAVTGLILPADTSATKAARRLANINKAYNLSITDAEIVSIITSTAWYEAPAKAETSAEDKVLKKLASLLAE